MFINFGFLTLRSLNRFLTGPFDSNLARFMDRRQPARLKVSSADMRRSRRRFLLPAFALALVLAIVAGTREGAAAWEAVPLVRGMSPSDIGSNGPYQSDRHLGLRGYRERGGNWYFHVRSPLSQLERRANLSLLPGDGWKRMPRSWGPMPMYVGSTQQFGEMRILLMPGRWRPGAPGTNQQSSEGWSTVAVWARGQQASALKGAWYAAIQRLGLLP